MEKFGKDKDLAEMFHAFGMAEGRPEKAAAIVTRSMPWLRKADVGGSQHSDLAGSFLTEMGGLFLQSLDGGPGIFDTIRPFGRQARFMMPLFIGEPLIAVVVGESVSIPVVKYAVDSAGLIPKKVAGLAVATNESLKTREGADALQEELKQAVILATDFSFLSDMAAGADTTESATGDPVADLKKLLDGVNLSGFGNLFWAISPETANFLATFREGIGGNLVFPDMAPRSGSLLGVQALVTGALTDTMLLLDAGGIVTGSSEMQIKLSQNCSVEMADNPAMNSQTPAAATGKVVSMFQTESSAVIGIRSFACKLMRASAVAVLSGLIAAWVIGTAESES